MLSIVLQIKVVLCYAMKKSHIFIAIDHLVQALMQKNFLADGRYSARYAEHLSAATGDLSPTSTQASVSGTTPTPLKLNNIGMLLRQLQYSDDITR